MREKIIEGLKAHIQGKMYKHITNVHVLLEKPIGVAEHPDIVDTIESELSMLADCVDKLEVLNKFFNENN